MSKKIAIVLAIENIPRFLQQIKLLIKTVREHNPYIPIYAITPTKYKLTSDDQQWLESRNVRYIFKPEAHSICRDRNLTIHNAIMGPQVCLIASNIIEEDFILYLDNDCICLKPISEHLSNLDTLVHTVPYNVSRYEPYIDKTVRQYLVDFQNSTERHLKLLKHPPVTTNMWPTSWFIYHQKNTTFWKRWRDYIYTNTVNIISNKLLSRYNLQEVILEQLIELFLYDELISGQLEYDNKKICQLSYLDIEDVDNLDCVFYNYGGFEQQAYKIYDIPVVSRYIRDYNITLNSDVKSIAQIDPGWYSKHIFE